MLPKKNVTDKEGYTMLSETELKSEEFLTKAIKKSFHQMLIPTIQELMDTIETQRLKIEELERDNAMLQNQVNHCNGLLNSTEYKMALALKEWVTSVANGAVRSQTPPIIREQVIKHLNVNVDTEAEYDPYSGRRDPYYTSSAEVSWK